MDAFGELRERRIAKVIFHADAIAFQGNAREHAKRYFNARRQPMSFEIGDLVLVKEVSRRAKLQDRYISHPFRIVAKRNNVYDLVWFGLLGPESPLHSLFR